MEGWVRREKLIEKWNLFPLWDLPEFSEKSECWRWGKWRLRWSNHFLSVSPAWAWTLHPSPPLPRAVSACPRGLSSKPCVLPCPPRGGDILWGLESISKSHSFLVFNWRKTVLERCVGFCHRTPISRNYMYIPSLLSLPLLPVSHPSRSLQSSGLGSRCYTATSHQLSVSHMMGTCANASSPIRPLLPPPLGPHVCSLHLRKSPFFSSLRILVCCKKCLETLMRCQWDQN